MPSTRSFCKALSVLCAVLPLAGVASHRPLRMGKPQFKMAPVLEVNPSGSVPLAAIVRFTTDRPVRAKILLRTGQETRPLYETKDYSQDFSLAVLGLRANSDHSVTIVATDESREELRSEPLAIHTQALPADFPLIRATTSDATRMEPGVTLFNLNQSGVGLIVAVNHDGEIIWYYRQKADGITDIRRMHNGHLLFTDVDGAAEIDMLGNVYHRWHPTNLHRPGPPEAIPLDIDMLHHEMYEMQSGNLLTLGTELRSFPNYPMSPSDADSSRTAASVIGDVITEFQADGKIVRRISLLDILDPYRIGANSLQNSWDQPYHQTGTRDWAHGNAVIEDVRDDSVIVSMRHQDALVKVDRKTGRLKWILGTPAGWKAKWTPYLLQPKGTLQWPYHQHAPTITSQGTLLLFDNGNVRHWPTESLPDINFSRAVEYAIDEKKMTVSQVWSYGWPDGELFFSTALGDADMQPTTGNVLIVDGNRTDGGHLWARILEVTHTKPSQKIFELMVTDALESNHSGWKVYRAERLPSLYPELE